MDSPQTRLGLWMDRYVGGLFRFMDKYSLSRRTALYISLWLTLDSYVWAKNFAEQTQKDSLQVPAIIAAVLAAVSLMQGWILKLYIEGKEPLERPE